MITFRVVPQRLEIRGQYFGRGTILHFDEFVDDGEPKYRLWQSRLRSDGKWQYFTQKQLDAMQPHWLTTQEELDL